MFFSKDDLVVIVALKKDGLVLRLQKNYRIRNGTTKKTISIKSTDRVYLFLLS